MLHVCLFTYLNICINTWLNERWPPNHFPANWLYSCPLENVLASDTFVSCVTWHCGLLLKYWVFSVQFKALFYIKIICFLEIMILWQLCENTCNIFTSHRYFWSTFYSYFISLNFWRNGQIWLVFSLFRMMDLWKVFVLSFFYKAQWKSNDFYFSFSSYHFISWSCDLIIFNNISSISTIPQYYMWGKLLNK